MELGAKTGVDCKDCDQPIVEIENEIVLDIYGLGPVWVTDFGAIGIDTSAVILLLDEFGIADHRERISIIRRVIFYHNELQKKQKK